MYIATGIQNNLRKSLASEAGGRTRITARVVLSITGTADPKYSSHTQCVLGNRYVLKCLVLMKESMDMVLIPESWVNAMVVKAT